MALADEKTVLSCSVWGGGDSLPFLDAMLAFRVQKVGCLLNHDNKPFLMEGSGNADLVKEPL